MILVKINLILTLCLIFSTAKAEDFIFSAANKNVLDQNKKTIIFIHGSPGDHTAFKKYLDDKSLNETFNMIAIDRPGFGESQKYNHQPDMSKQAEIIFSELNKKYDINNLKEKTYIFSHSYGAPLSILLSSYLNTLPNLILVAGPYNPDFNMKRWYNYIASFPIINFIIGKSWRFSNEEMMKLNLDLIKVKEALSQYKGKTFFIHGRSDGLVPIKHSRWAHSLRGKLNFDSEIFEYSSNHFIIWNNFKKMRDFILELK